MIENSQQNYKSNFFLIQNRRKVNYSIQKGKVLCIISMIFLVAVFLLINTQLSLSAYSSELHNREEGPPVESKSAQNEANTVFPGSEVGKRAEAFWKAFEKADRARLTEFFRISLPAEKLREVSAEERAGRLLGLRQRLGEIKAVKILNPGPQAIEIFAISSQQEMFKISLAFEVRNEGQGKNYFLKGLQVDEASPQDLAPPLPPMSLSQALQEIEKEIGRVVAEDKFSGVVLIASDFKPVFFKAYGYASKEFASPNQLNTRFNLGSINKIFTKIAVAQLVEKGQLSLDDKLGKFLPDYPNAEAREKVTVRHLVNMTSGIGDFFGSEFRATPKDFIRHNRDFLRFFAAKPLAFEPGSREMYSNGGYVVLGEIISVVSGMDYYEYVRKNIFEPAGMKDSDWFEADAVVENVAEGYTRQVDNQEKRENEEKKLNPAMIPWRKNIYSRPARGSAAGGGYATAEDLLRFARALYEGRLLSWAWTDWVFTGVEPHKLKAAGVETNQNRLNIGLAGGAPGINAVLELDGQNRYTIIVLANYDPPAAGDVARMVRRYLKAVKNQEN